MASSNGGVPPGFRFHPTDEELLHYYLKKKVSFQKFDMEVIREVDLNKMEPWELQEKCKIGSMPQNEWYFFSHKDRKYPTGSRTNRATSAGFWKATGRDKCIRSTFKRIGMRKTLVFYRGRAPHGQKTDWIMHEYRLEDGDDDPQANSNEDGWVVCKVFKKKNLFKIGNEGGSNMNNSRDQQNTNTSSTDQHRTFMHRSENQYLMIRHQHQHQHQHQQNQGNPSAYAFELDKPAGAAGLALHYPHSQPHHHHYSLFQPHQPNILSTAHESIVSYDYSATTLPRSSDQSPLMVKQLMSNARDCESADSESLRYQVYEPGDLEVGTCDQQPQPIGAAAARDDQSEMNEWGMLDRLVTSHEYDNASSANPIRHLTLRGEMNLWGYGKQ